MDRGRAGPEVAPGRLVVDAHAPHLDGPVGVAVAKGKRGEGARQLPWADLDRVELIRRFLERGQAHRAARGLGGQHRQVVDPGRRFGLLACRQHRLGRGALHVDSLEIDPPGARDAGARRRGGLPEGFLRNRVTLTSRARTSEPVSVTGGATGSRASVPGPSVSTPSEIFTPSAGLTAGPIGSARPGGRRALQEADRLTEGGSLVVKGQGVRRAGLLGLDDQHLGRGGVFDDRGGQKVSPPGVDGRRQLLEASPPEVHLHLFLADREPVQPRGDLQVAGLRAGQEAVRGGDLLHPDRHLLLLGRAAGGGRQDGGVGGGGQFVAERILEAVQLAGAFPHRRHLLVEHEPGAALELQRRALGLQSFEGDAFGLDQSLDAFLGIIFAGYTGYAQVGHESWSTSDLLVEKQARSSP